MNRTSLFLLALIGIFVAGCAIPIPPTVPPSPTRRGVQPRSYKMKLAVFNFVDQTGSAGKLVETIPDVLSTELFNKFIDPSQQNRRFELKERAELREIQPGKIEEIRERYKQTVDSFIIGSITRFSADDKLMTVDVRVINAPNGTVMYAGPHEVRYEGVLDVKANRDDLDKISEAIFSAFPVLSEKGAKVTSISGTTITINVGSAQGAKIGMGCLIIGRGDTIRDPLDVSELDNQIFVGEAYMVEVSGKSSKAVVQTVQSLDGVKETIARSKAEIRIGDGVRFK